MKTRGSKVGLLLTCPASRVPPAVRIEGDDSAARLGSAVHEWIGKRINPYDADEPMESVASRWRVDFDEMRRLCLSAAWCWEQVVSWFPEVVVECQISHPIMPCRPDLLSVDGDMVRIGDWKTGRLDEDHGDQMRAYCWAALQIFPECTRAESVVIRVREQDTTVTPYGRHELQAWFAGVVAALDGPEIYRPGVHCGRCHRAWECPARREMLASLWAVAVAHPKDCIEIGALRDAGKMLAEIAESIDTQVKTEVLLAGGSIDIDGGRKLVLAEQRRTTIDADRAWDRIQFDFGIPKLLDSGTISVSGTKLRQLISDAAPHGAKGKAVAGYMEGLEEAGAIKVTYFDKLEVRRSDTTSDTNTDDDAA